MNLTRHLAIKNIVLMLILFCVFLSVMTVAKSETVVDKPVLIGNFSQGDLSDWQPQKFVGKTQYKFIYEKGKPDKQVLMSDSHGTASGLAYQQRIDLHITPWLNWSWKTNKILAGLDESQKSGDDFALRLYVIVDGGLLFWKTQALNYVWSSSHNKGENWPNPYTDNAMMYAVEAGEKGLGQWQYYSRNVRDDLKHFLAKDIRYIDAVAIMTDTDNSQQKATAYYGDIFFTKNKQTPVLENKNEINQ